MADLASNWIEVFKNVSKQVNGLILWRRFCGFELPKPKAVKVSHQSTQDGWGWQRTTGINPLTTKIKISFLCTVFHTLLIRCQLEKKLQTYVFISTYHFLFHINWDYHTTGTAPLMQAHTKLTTVKADVRRAGEVDGSRSEKSRPALQSLGLLAKI